MERVPAYRAFLHDKIGGAPDVETMAEFESLPFMSKADYVLQYPLPDLCLDGNVGTSHLWLRSSGTSKKPFFWPRRAEDEKNFPAGMQRLFHEYTAPEAQPTLIVVGLALGPWGTGMQTSFAFRLLARETDGLAVVSPGLQNESIIEVLERLSPHYRQTLLLSYPPFAKIVLEEAAQRGINLPALNIRLMVGGEGITETYRERMWKLLGCTEHNLNCVWSLYGSTDFANVGFENPLTIAARRLMVKHNLCKQILGEPDVPMLFQRAPSDTWFEEVDGELVVTRLQGIPLIRYRTGDHVRIVSRHDLLARLRDAGHDAEQVVRDAGLPVPEFDTPFIALYGRIDQAIFFYGAKITVEQIKTALDSPAMTPYYNGKFLIRGTESEKGDPLVELAIENSEALQQADLDEVTELFCKELEKVQSEFRQVRSLAPGKQHLRLVPSQA
ncbi:MAG: phenylacetate--CoA ligase family protein [Desulfatitalea sp.]|nr:phenylacetate--CoA ligase family protein [Desulfatitalea sp.]